MTKSFAWYGKNFFMNFLLLWVYALLTPVEKNPSVQ